VAKKRTKKAGGGRKKVGARRTTGSVSSRAGAGMSADELKAALGQQRRRVEKLVARREALAQQLAELDDEISAFEEVLGPVAGGSRGGGRSRGASRARSGTGRKRPRNESTLEDALAKVLSGREMGVTEAATAVQQAGYKTNAENFRTIVNQTLIRSDRFKKIRRGLYTAA